MPRSLLLSLVLALLSGGILAAEVPQETAPARRAILVLSSERSDLPSIPDFERGLREKLSAPGGAIEFFVEYLDFGRFPEPRHEAGFVRHLRDRYAGRRIDVVVPFQEAAFEFLLAHRAQLFPDIPVVAAGMERQRVEGRQLQPGITTIPVIYDYRRTLELALALQPGAREVLVVHGIAQYDLLRRDDARRSLETFAPKLRYRMLSGVPLPEIETAVRNLPSSSLVLFLSMVRDAEGRSLVGQDYVGRLAAVSPVPIYGTFKSHMERGTLGGAITDFTAVGRATADLVSQALAGDLPSGPIALQVPETPLRVNWRALEQWRVPAERIPRDAQILFREPGIWEQYRGYALAAIAAVLLQALLITGLLVQAARRRRAEADRKRAEETLRLAQNELEHVGRVSTMGEIAGSLAHELSQPLAAILMNAQAGLRFIERGNPDPQEIREILQDVVADDKRAGEVVGALRSMLRRGKTESAVIDVARAARDVLSLLHSELVAQQIEVGTTLDTGCFVVANKTQIEQVLLNLVMNGIDAMRQQPVAGRRMDIEVSRTDGNAVRVAVRDSGVGIPDDELEKVFDAFWTTKPSGMGMGLAVCSSIVKSCGGGLRVEPNAGRGVTFSFTLPLVQDTVSQSVSN